MHQIPFLEPCPGCGGFTEVYTKSCFLVLNAFFANVGDIVRCTRCECQGEILPGAFGNTCEWQTELCGVCEGMIMAQIRQLLTI